MSISKLGKIDPGEGIDNISAIESLLSSLKDGQGDLPALLDILPIGISIATDASCENIRHNAVAAKYFGIQPWENRSQSGVNSPLVKVMHQGRQLLPEEMPMQRAAWQGREIRDYELDFVQDDGACKTALCNASPLFNDQGIITRAVVTFKDITEQKRTNRKIHRQNDVLSGINRILRDGLTCDTEESLGITCLAVAEELTESEFGFIGEINSAGVMDYLAVSNLSGETSRGVNRTGHCKMPKGFTIQGTYGRELLGGNSFFTNDPSSQPDGIGLPEGYPPVSSFLGVPLIHEGRTIGMIGLGNHRGGGYRSDDLEAVESLSHAIVQDFMRKRAEQEIRRLNEELEQRVLERTGELEAANQNLAVMNKDLVENTRRLESEIKRRRESELALQASSQKVANILESFSDAFYALDHEWRLTYVNAEALRQFKLQDESAVIGKVLWDAFPNHTATAFEMFHKAVAEQIVLRYEVYSPVTNRWHDVHAYPSPEGLSVYFLDITELKETQEKFKKSQQDISDILSSISDPFVVIDKDWRITYINYACAGNIGPAPAELLGKNLLDSIPNLAGTAIYKNYCKAMAENIPMHFDAKGANGSLLYNFNAYPCQGGLAIYRRDITKEMKLQQKLLASQARFHTAIENMMDNFGIFAAIRNTDGKIEDFRIEYVNEATCTNTAMNRVELVGKRCLDVFPYHRNTELFDKACRVVETGEPLATEILAWDDTGHRYLTGANETRIVKMGDGLAISWRNVIERKRVDEELRNSEKQLRLIMDTIPSIMTYVDSEKRFKYVNKAHELWWGTSGKDAQGKYIWEVVAEETYHKLQTYIDTALAGQRVVYEDDLPGKDGEKHYFYTVMVPEIDACGAVNGYISVTSDVTESRTMERQIAEALEFNQKILESSPLGISTFDSSGQCIFANDAAAGNAGGSKDLLLQHNFNSLQSWKQTGLLDIAQRVLLTGTPENHEVHVLNGFGKRAWWDCRFSRFTSGGEINLLFVYEDVSERKRMEEEVRNSEKQLGWIMDAVPSIMAYVDSEKRYKYINRAYEAWWQVNRKDVRGKHVWEVIGEEAYHKLQVHVDIALSGEQVFYEVKLPGGDSKQHYFYSVMIPEIDDQGVVRGYTSLSNDMTEFRTMEQKIAETLEFNKKLLQASPMRVVTHNYSGQLVFDSNTSAIHCGRQKVASAEAASFGYPWNLPQERLTGRELEVLQLMAEGLGNQDIAERLGVALRTVKSHASNILTKLMAKNRLQAVQRGRKLGILSS